MLKRTKKPLLFTAAFLFFVLNPVSVCAALSLQPSQQQPAALTETASSSFALRSEDRAQRIQTAQQQIQPRTSQGQLQPALVTPSLITDLQYTLSTLKSQLAKIKSATPKDPNNSDQLRLEISRIQTQILKLEEQVQAAQQRYDEYLAATQVYDQALQSLNEAQAAYDQASQLLTEADQSKATAQQELTQAQQATQEAQQAQLQAQYVYNNSFILDPSWTRPTIEITQEIQVPYTVLIPHETTITLQGGLTAYCYNRQGYNNAPPLPYPNEVPIATSIVPNINYNWGGGYVLDCNRSEDVLVKFQGTIVIPTSDTYNFYISADDGDILEIDNQRLISGWWDKGGGGPTSYPTYLEAGSHQITVYFYENGGGAAITLYYYTPSAPYWQLIPNSFFGEQVVTTITYTEETRYRTEYVTTTVPDETAVHPQINDPANLPYLEQKNQELEQAQNNQNQAEEEYQLAISNFARRDEEFLAAEVVLASTQNQLITETSNVASSESAYTSSAQTAQQTANSISFTQAESLINKEPPPPPAPEPNPTPEEPTPTPTPPTELPPEVTADNLQEIDLNQIDPTTLTPEQADMLVEAALETFQTAEQGSPEYEQALDALYLAAEQDDIELPTELAAIPGLQAAVEVLNFFGNAGADMSPKVREESKKVVVTAVVAAGAAIQSAAAAATTSAASTRRIGK